MRYNMSPLLHLQNCLQRYHVNRFALAISGGGDSMAMAKLAVAYAQEYQSAVHALIVDHKLRPESTQEAYQVALWCQDLGLPHTILTWHHDGIKTSLQEQARKARYQLMAQWCQAHHFDYVLTAHHANDVMETFMMRLLKGSSLKGLCAMTPKRTLYGITILRPFLGVSCKQLRSVLDDQPYIQDPSNDNPQFERVRMRQWLKDIPDIEGFLKSYDKLQQADAILKDLVDQFAKDHIHHQDIQLEPLLALQPLIFHRVFKNYVFDDFVEDVAIEHLRQALMHRKTVTLNHKKFTIIQDNLLRITQDGRNGGI